MIGLLESIRFRLAAAGTAGFRRTMQSFSKEPLDPYGVPSPAVKKMAAEAWREVRHWPPARRNQFCNALWKSGRDEEGTLAVYLYQRFARQCGKCEFRLFESWIDRYVRNWGHCDGVAHYLISAAIAREPALSAELVAWTASPNRWKRRAAAVALVHEARAGRQSARIREITRRLARDPDELVRKAVRWLGRESGRL
ncbi:MAG: DNA alkylation repair protein [Bryobacteraceae bacterium]